MKVYTKSNGLEVINIRKIVISFMLLTVLCLLLVFGFSVSENRNGLNAEAAFALYGSGTQADPYQIEDALDLMDVVVKVNDDKLDTANVYFVLTQDIDMSGVDNFRPIGTAAKPFAGHFIGGVNEYNYHVISNLVSPQGGLFGQTANSAKIEGVGLLNANVGDDTLTSNVGGLVGTNRGLISHSFFNGTVKGISNVGGLVGLNGSTFLNTAVVRYSYSSGSVVASGSFVGGLVGRNECQIFASYSLSIVDAAFWSGGGTTYGGNIGGVLGGRIARTDDISTTPKFVYFNRSVNNPNMNAIGYGSESMDNTAVQDDPTTNKYVGLTSELLATKPLNEMFSTVHESHFARKYTVSDRSAVYAPVLKKLVPTTGEHNTNVKFKHSVAIRNYGYDPTNYEVWGSIDNPFLIENATHFDNLAKNVTRQVAPESYINRFFKQTKDIDFSDMETLMIVGHGDNRYYPFSGTYDGDMKKIKNFNLEGTEYATQNRVGLFGLLSSNATVKNIIIDETCSFVGRSSVGSLVGYSSGATVSTIHSRAKVFASSEKGGGIIGEAEGGNYSNILSDVSFVGVTEQLAPKHKGVLGYQSQITSFVNVWYVNNPLRTLSISSTDEYGNTITINPELGSIVSSIDNTGQITFTLNANPGWSGEFRTDKEVKLSTSNVYQPDKNMAQRNFRYYGRFVKIVDLMIVDSDDQAVSGLTCTVLPTLESKFWSAQSFELTLKLGTIEANGKYIDSIKFYNADNQLITIFHEYKYFSHSSELKIKVIMSAALETIKVVAEDINLIGDAFNSPKEYTGSEVYTLVPSRDLLGGGPDGFTFTLDNHGTSPINAIEDGRLSIVYAKDGVTRGKLQRQYTITKKQLSVNFNATDHDVVVTEKEYDGLGGLDGDSRPIYQSTVVSQSKVIGIVSNDANNEAKLVISAEIHYSSPDVSANPDVPVIVRFSMRGLSARNYILPAEVSGNFGNITKRAVSVVIQRAHLEKEYDAKAPAIVAHHYWAGENIPEVLNDKLPKVPPNFNFSPAGHNIGSYTLTATFRDVTDNDFFNLYLKIENPTEGDPVGNQTSLTYKIKSRSRIATYAGFNESDYEGGVGETLVYNSTRVMNYSATFNDLGGVSNALSFQFYEKVLDPSEADITIGENSYKLMVSTPSMAGEYAAMVVEGDNFGITPETAKTYYIQNPIKEFIISKATQDAISIISNPSMNFNEAYTLGTSGGSGDGVVTYNIVSDNPTYNSTGEVLIGENGVVTTVKAGKVYVIAVKAESDNYNATQSSPFELTINKVTILLGIKSFEIEYGSSSEMQFSFANDTLEKPAGFTNPPKVRIEKNDVFCGYYSDETLYDAGVYNLEIEAETATASSDGYEFEYDTTTVSTLTVNKMKIKVKADSKNLVYGSNAPLTYKVYSNSDTLLENVLLSGSLTRAAGNNVGTYNIGVGNIVTKNPNYQITFTGATYKITKAQLTVSITPQTKEYASPDPAPAYTVEGLKYSDTISSIGLNGVIERATGEDAFKSGDPTQYRTYAYFVQPDDANRFKHNSSNYEATVFVNPSVLTIVPKTPSFSDLVKVYVQYGDALSNARYGVNKSETMPDALATAKGKRLNVQTNEWETITLTGVYEWRTPEFKPNFQDVASVPCEVMFRPYDRNYKRSFFTISVLPIKLEVTVEFEGTKEFEYDGSSHKSISCTFSGVRGTDSLNEQITYSGDVKDVGVYTVTVTINQGNYILTGTKTTKIIITPKTLIVSHPDTEVALGEVIDYNFTYEGFVFGEDETVLISTPVIEYEQVAGLQEGVRAKNATATNYTIVYEPFNVTVLRTEIPPEEEGDVTIYGVFKDNIVSQSRQVEEGLDYKKIAGKVEAAKKKTEEITNTAIASLYLLKFVDQNTGDVVVNSGATKIKITLSEEQLAEFENYTILSVSYSGDIAVLNSPEIDEENAVEFDIENIESIVFLKQVAPPIDFKRYIPIAAGGVGAIIVIAVVISIIVKKKNARRIIKFKQN